MGRKAGVKINPLPNHASNGSGYRKGTAPLFIIEKFI